MLYHLFTESSDAYPIAVLVKQSAFKKDAIQTSYIEPLIQQGISLEDMIAVSLPYEGKKASAKFIKEQLNELLPELDSVGTQYLFCTDSAYYKVLARQAKADPHYGYVYPCAIKGYEHMHVVLGVNHQQLIFNPALQSKLNQGLQALAMHVQGTYIPPDEQKSQNVIYPKTTEEIEQWLKDLHKYPALTCDIETFSLDFDKAGIGTIAFAWDEHHAIAFPCDYRAETTNDGIQVSIGYSKENKYVRRLLKGFLETYQGKLIYHNAGFDVKVLIYNLWMKDLQDTAGLLAGLETMTRNIDDTMIITYLATNSTAGNELGLKELAQEFMGNWAISDIKDISSVPLSQLLGYNATDALATWFVYKKYWPIMVKDNQEDIYRNLMMPTQQLILQMELTGLPMDPEIIQSVKYTLEGQRDTYLDVLINHPVIKMLNLLLQQTAMETANAKLKKKQHPLEKFQDKVFNPNSGPQLQRLLYEQMGLPVLDYTDTKQPAVGADTLKKLINHTQEPTYKEILVALIGYSQVEKILSTFIPAFEDGILKKDGRKYLHGSFKIGGTVSGRLSSVRPNMQNIPAGQSADEVKAYIGKQIKSCVKAPDGWLFVGADFNSLEDYISALTTKDPNKLDVYIRGFDGHCLRAAYYFRDELPHIDLDDPQSVNTIKGQYPSHRQDSKAPTFLLTYGGTYHGLMNNLGWPQDKAQAIETNYHELYKVSDEYVRQKLVEASKTGYVEVAFGLRVRTPLLKQVIFGSKGMPHEAAAEGRTAGNALGQSYGLLNNRAAVEFMRKVWASKYRYDILPVALIHDAIYLLVRDNPEVVEWVNRELIKSMQWQELPEIQHPTVKLGAALDIFWPSWANPITLPNNATQAEIKAICKEAKLNYGVTK